jgi:AmmeMemoRadiSam system protein A
MNALKAEDCRRLLRIARGAIEARLRDEPVPREAVGLEQPAGAFVTLRRRADGELRGCVGYTEPKYALVEAVSLAAVAAATLDSRFSAVTPEELPSLRVEISVLGPLRRIEPGEVEVGLHGVTIRHGGCSGLLLPQVATEHGWDRSALLDALCRKAGLAPGSWREPGAEISVFTATVFGED